MQTQINNIVVEVNRLRKSLELQNMTISDTMRGQHDLERKIKFLETELCETTEILDKIRRILNKD